MNSHYLKQLQTRKNKLAAELSRLDTERREAQRAYDDTASKLRTIEREIKDATKDIVVSEHAILRYFERVLGFDLDVVKGAILTDERKALVRSLGNGKYPLPPKGQIVVKDSVVVSVV